MKFLSGQIPHMGAELRYYDGAGTPKKSPLAITATIVEVVIPDGSIAAYMKCPEQAIRIGSDATHANGYELIDAGSWCPPIPCQNKKSIFVRTDSGSGNLSFRFEVLG